MTKTMTSFAERVIKTLEEATTKEFPALSNYDGIRRVLVKEDGENVLTYTIREDYKGRKFVGTEYNNGTVLLKYEDEWYSEYFQTLKIFKSEDGTFWLPGFALGSEIGAYPLDSEGSAKAVFDYLRIGEYVALSA